MKDYLICKGLKEEYSVREFLRTQGYSAADIDLFYEKYRKECLHCYFREPKEPMYSNGILKVYEVEGIFCHRHFGGKRKQNNRSQRSGIYSRQTSEVDEEIELGKYLSTKLAFR